VVQFIISLSAVLIVTFIMAFVLTFKRTWTFNFMIWGLYLALFFSPIFTIAGSFIVTDIEQDGFAGIGFLLLIVPLEIIAILIFVVGCLGSVTKKINKKKSINKNPNIPL